MITIIIPAAGEGTRFRLAGYTVAKPLIDVCGKPMIKRVMDNVTPNAPHRVIIISRMADTDIWPLLGHDDLHIRLTSPTEGAIDTILRAKQFLSSGPLIIANCDQLAKFSVNDFTAAAHGIDGAIVTFKSSTPHHSYVVTDDLHIVTEIAEKRVILSQAVTGIYYFCDGLDFMAHAEEVIARNDRYNSEFYLSSALARMITNGRQFVTYEAPAGMLGTPDELQLFEMAVEVGREL